MKYCKKCAKSMDDDAVFCPKCGTADNASNPNSIVGQPYNPSDPRTAALVEQNKKKTNGFVVAVFIFIAIVIIVGIIGSSGSSNSSSSSSRSTKNDSYTKLKEAIGDNMTDEQFKKITDVLAECGVTDKITDAKVFSGLETKYKKASVCYNLTTHSAKNIYLFLDKDSNVVALAYYQAELYANGKRILTLQDITLTSSEKNVYIDASKDAVKQMLKSPSTAKFPWYDEYQVSMPINEKTKAPDGTVIVVGYVDSQNGFGAMIRSTYRVKYQKSNNEVLSIIIDDRTVYTASASGKIKGSQNDIKIASNESFTEDMRWEMEHPEPDEPEVEPEWREEVVYSHDIAEDRKY